MGFCSRATTLACTVLALAGCENRQPPQITLGEASVTQVTSEAVAFDVPVDMINPNLKELELQEFRYTVSVDGRQVFQGRRSAEASLPAEGGKRVRIPGVVRFDQMNWPVPPQGSPPEQASYRVSGTLTYIVPGALAEILFDTGVRRPRAGFSGEGVLALMAPIPPPATDSIEVISITVEESVASPQKAGNP
jgi:LEA14-like dessication related protein